MADGVATSTHTPELSLYEQSRELRIKENLERMQKLGIVDLSLKLKSSNPPKRNGRKSSNLKNSPLPYEILPSGGPPRRRSSRLQNVTPVSYSEVQMDRRNRSSEIEDVLLEAGAKPEVYTEEHEKLLGNTEKSWTLFVDGYGNDGKRIYDSVKGKTCHQCRQKTLGNRTHCSQCNMVQGQFCGDCLYMRYGEHVLEAQQNPNWICPVCRGICNCSLCRQGKGWLPTGTLYKKISRLGYKSVAHFLIQTKRSQPSSEQEPTNLLSAKRSLSFTDFEVISAGSLKVIDNPVDTSEHHFEINAVDEFESNAVDEFDNEQKDILQAIPSDETENCISSGRSLDFSCSKQDQEGIVPPKLEHEIDKLGLSNLEFADYKFGEKEKGLKRKNDDNHIIKEASEVQCNSFSINQSLENKPDIGGQTSSESIAEQIQLEHCNHPESSVILDNFPEISNETVQQLAQDEKLDINLGANLDSMNGRLRKRLRNCNNDDDNMSLPTKNERSIDHVNQEQQIKEPAMVLQSGSDYNVRKMKQERSSRDDMNDGIFQGTNGKTKVQVKLSTSPNLKSDSISSRLRSRQKIIS